MKTRYSSGGNWTLACALGVGLVGLLGGEGVASAVVKYPVGSGHTWPADSAWRPISSLNDPDDGLATDRLDFVGDATYPGFYVYYDTASAYIYFRIRVDAEAEVTYSDTVMVMIDYDRNGTADYAIAWDSKDALINHGLEMLVKDTIGSAWNNTKFNDVDGNNAQKLMNDINGNSRSEGFVRTTDQISTTSFGNTAFIDFAISCNYFLTYSGTPLRCGQNWSLQIGSIQNATDHNNITYDVGGGLSPSDPPTWFGPTAAVVADVQAHLHAGVVSLEWTTASELATAGFRIERQTATGFVPVGPIFVPGFFTTPVGGQYRVSDPGAPTSGPLTYRIVEMETGGTQRTYGPFTVTVDPAPLDPDPRGAELTLGYRRTARDTGAQPPRQDHGRAGRFVASPAAVQLPIRADGLYYVSAADLAARLGWTLAQAEHRIRSGLLRLTRGGVEASLWPAPGGAGLYFYGQTVWSPYDRDTIYRLAPGRGRSFGARMGKPPKAQAAPSIVRAIVDREEDLSAVSGYARDPDSDWWVWKYLLAGDASAGTRQLDVTLPHLAPGAATLVMRLRGGTATEAVNDHHALVSVNGVFVGETWFDDQAEHEVALEIPDGILLHGDNVVTVTAVRDAGVPYSIFYLDGFSIDHARYAVADAGALTVPAAAAGALTVTGLDDPEVVALDLADPLHPQLLRVTLAPDGAGAWSATLGSPGSQVHVSSLAAALAPARLDPVGAPGLRGSDNGADYLVIAPSSLLVAAGELAAYRAGQGLATRVVDLESIYDEFSHGQATPAAIHDFLAAAVATWTPAPRYVVLAGDGSWDYRDLAGLGGPAVPALLVGTAFGLAASDTRMADVSGADGRPDLALGRLPVGTEAELIDFLGKLAAYEQSSGDWTDRTLLVADDPDANGAFPIDSDWMGSLLPEGTAIERVYSPAPHVALSRDQLLAAWDAGASLVNFLGHAGLDRWTQEGLLLATDVPGLANGDQLPLVLAFTCVAGNFAMPYLRTISEALVLSPDGGAIAVVAASSMSLHEDARELDAAYLHALHDGGSRRLGDVHLRAYAAYLDAGGTTTLTDHYNLLGDPATELR